MKRLLWVALAAFALPMAAFANNSVDLTNSGGTLSGTSVGLSLSGSELIAVNGLNGLGLITGDLGSVTFSTGGLTSGSLEMGGTFAAGGSFTITGNGSNGIPAGTLFSGKFDAPVTWTLITLANGTHNYTLSGTLSGATGTGMSAVGVTVQLTINTGKGFFNGSSIISSGDTNLASSSRTKGVVPESGSLSLLGTGLFGLATLVHRKRRSQPHAKESLAERRAATDACFRKKDSHVPREFR